MKFFSLVLFSVCLGQEFPCKDEPSTYENGMFEFCWIDEEYTYLGQEFPKGTGIHFNEQGELYWVFLPDDMNIQGIGCRGGGHSFMTGFHPNGKLRLSWLIEDQIIQDVPCAKFNFFKAIFAGFHGKSGGTYFWDNGNLRSCELSEDFEKEEISFVKGEIIKLDQTGSIVKANDENNSNQ